VLYWYVLQYAYHEGVQRLVKDLNRLYRQFPALHTYEFDWQGFEWLDCNDWDQSVLSFVRRADNEFLVVVINCTAVPRKAYRIGVPQSGIYAEVLNSDSEYYGGSNMGNGNLDLTAEQIPWMNRPWSLCITLPPLAALAFARP